MADPNNVNGNNDDGDEDNLGLGMILPQDLVWLSLRPLADKITF